MDRNLFLGLGAVAALTTLVAVGGSLPPAQAPLSVTPATMARISTVDERYQSYNIEMAEVIGGNFWKPYAPLGSSAQPAKPAGAAPASNTPGLQIGLDPAMFEARPPADLSNARLRMLARALGPAYVRVSGTWANSVYFQDSDDPAPSTPPSGFRGVLTRQQWKGVIDFSGAVDAKIVTSFAVSKGVRDLAGVWTPDQARALLAYTKSIGGEIAAAEFFNEPSFAAMGGAPPGYDAAAFARDFANFRSFAKGTVPGMLVVGPGSVGEGVALGSLPLLRTEDLLAATPPPIFDAFSYHFYGTVSERCASLRPGVAGTTAGAALSEGWLSRTDQAYDFYARLRDRFAPGAPMWLTETAEAACGGDRWAATFLDSFRYLDQLGRMARRGVRTVMHNTLAASDYGLIDGKTLTPRPNYWAAVLWRRLMGATVLDAGPTPPGLHLYAQCLPDHAGGVTLLAINTSRDRAETIDLQASADRYTLTAQPLETMTVRLNGTPLQLDAKGDIPPLLGRPAAPGRVELAPMSITFLAVPDARNRSCQ